MYPVYLPKTKFNIYEKDFEDEILDFWESINLQKLRESKRKGETPFVLHDGPPYANGNLHMGHAENKIWKDVLNRLYWQSGYDVKYILGWDAHGLPIENAVEKELRKDGIDKNSLSHQEFWDKCYAFASYWIEVQKKGFKKLGVLADYDNPYVTFKENESIGIMECIHYFVEKNLITQKYRPVLWSYVEKTALAYAEVEYKNKVSESLYVGFPVAKTECRILEGASLLIWTTTPWTLPANEAVCYNADFEYIIFNGDGKKYCVEKQLFDKIRSFFACIEIFADIDGSELDGTFVEHCLEEFNDGDLRPLLNGSHVDNEKGTGFVHTAPAHGEEDFEVCLKYSVKIVDYLDHHGCFNANVPLVAGMHVKDANNFVVQMLKDRGLLVSSQEYEHSYPHSWRSKAPLIYRLTKQWFLNMKVLKKNALELAQGELGWVPLESKNRFVAMCSTREDWCISRQRIWGVPLGIFCNVNTGQVLHDPVFLQKTRIHLKKIGVKNWRTCEVEDIDSQYSSKDWQRVDDIVDIWFESGATHDFVLKAHNLFPADVYLEGSDQHRGWFQSSFLISATKNGCSPWKNLVTHGFCLDADKKKMSKSLGNVVDPLAWDMDILRVFFSSLQLSADISLSDNIVNQAKECVFRFKNTIKFLLGNLSISKDVESVDVYCLENLEKWVLHKIYELDLAYADAMESLCVHNFINKLYEFCSQDLSAFYFDIKKDVLYCDAANTKKRAEVITVFRILTPILIKYLSIFMPYSMERSWQVYCDENDIPLEGDNSSVHLQDRPVMSDLYRDDDAFELVEKWIDLKKKVNEQIELLRAAKQIVTSHEASVLLNSKYLEELKDIFIVSEVVCVKEMVNMDNVEGLEDIDDLAACIRVVPFNGGYRCPRCKFFYERLAEDVCSRCHEVIAVDFKA